MPPKKKTDLELIAEAGLPVDDIGIQNSVSKFKTAQKKRKFCSDYKKHIIDDETSTPGGGDEPPAESSGGKGGEVSVEDVLKKHIEQKTAEATKKSEEEAQKLKEHEDRLT